MTLTRREVTRFLAGVAAIRGLRGGEPALAVSGLDHVKVRFASAGASAWFYYDLSGGDVVRVQNSTHPGDAPVDEFFRKMGSAPYPFLMFSQMRAGESAGLTIRRYWPRMRWQHGRCLNAGGLV